MVVVVIIAALAALAVPSVVEQLRDRRTQTAAQEVAALYRNARMRAMARGGAVLVRYDASTATAGRLEVREAIRGPAPDPNDPTTPDPTCAQLPVSSCALTSWQAANPDSKLVTFFDPGSRSEYANVNVIATGPALPPNAAQLQTQMDVCFSPLGRAFVRFNQNGPFVPMTGAADLAVMRRMGGDQVGLARSVIVMPNGHARSGQAVAP